MAVVVEAMSTVDRALVVNAASTVDRALAVNATSATGQTLAVDKALATVASGRRMAHSLHRAVASPADPDPASRSRADRSGSQAGGGVKPDPLAYNGG
jgi:hypothetical protein